MIYRNKRLYESDITESAYANMNRAYAEVYDYIDKWASQNFPQVEDLYKSCETYNEYAEDYFENTQNGKVWRDAITAITDLYFKKALR